MILMDSNSIPLTFFRKASRLSRAEDLIAALPSENRASAAKLTVSFGGIGAGAVVASGAASGSSARSSLAGCFSSDLTSTGAGVASAFGLAWTLAEVAGAGDSEI